MALYLIDNPKAYDAPIQRLQKNFYEDLDWVKLEVYPRIHKETIDGKVIPQFYIGGGEYTPDVFLNDNQNAHIFFEVAAQNHVKVSGPKYTCKAKIFFMVNLVNLFPEINHRAESECQSLAWEIINRQKEFDIINIETELDKVFKGYNIENIALLNTGPYHTFAINTNLSYHINK